MGESLGGTLRRGQDRFLGGVCSGLASYFHLDATLVRVIFVVMTLVPPGIGLIVYLVLWFLMEPATPDAAPATPGGGTVSAGQRLRRIGEDLRRDFGMGWWRAQSEPGGAAPPVPGASGATPSATPRSPWGGYWGRTGGRRSGGLWFGIVLVVLGVYLLLDNLGYLRFFRWDIFWPVALIAIGLLVLLRRYR